MPGLFAQDPGRLSEQATPVSGRIFEGVVAESEHVASYDGGPQNLL